MVSCSGDVRVCVLVFAGEGSRLLARRVRVLHLWLSRVKYRDFNASQRSLF